MRHGEARQPDRVTYLRTERPAGTTDPDPERTTRTADRTTAPRLRVRQRLPVSAVARGGQGTPETSASPASPRACAAPGACVPSCLSTKGYGIQPERPRTMSHAGGHGRQGQLAQLPSAKWAMVEAPLKARVKRTLALVAAEAVVATNDKLRRQDRAEDAAPELQRRGAGGRSTRSSPAVDTATASA